MACVDEAVWLIYWTKMYKMSIFVTKVNVLEIQYKGLYVFRTLTGNDAIGCSCYVIATLTIVKSVISGGSCGSPPAANGVVFDSGQSSSNDYFEKKPASTFLCCEYTVIIMFMSYLSLVNILATQVPRNMSTERFYK